jgi:hypothetical protein
MKKALLFFGMMSSFAYAQDCSKMFISEYVEGWSNNKALEIYNPTNAPIDLSEYFVSRYSNGSATASVQNSIQLSGTVPAHDVFVAVLDKRDPNGTGNEAPIWDSLDVRADGYFSPIYNNSDAFYWNGNDAVLLAKGNLAGLPATTVINSTNIPSFQIIDVFGKIGENPANSDGVVGASVGGAWSSTFPYNTGVGVLLSSDHSLIRKSSVLKGVTVNPSFFNPLLEYDSIPAVTYLFDSNGDTITGGSGNPISFGNWFSLGEHDCGCNPLSTGDNIQEEMVVYPNPSTDGVIYIKGATSVKEVVVYNALGQYVNKFTNGSNATMTLKLGHDKGVYIMRIVSVDGAVTSKRIVIK